MLASRLTNIRGAIAIGITIFVLFVRDTVAIVVRVVRVGGAIIVVVGVN